MSGSGQASPVCGRLHVPALFSDGLSLITSFSPLKIRGKPRYGVLANASLEPFTRWSASCLSNSIKKGTVGSLLFVMQAFFPVRFCVMDKHSSVEVGNTYGKCN